MEKYIKPVVLVNEDLAEGVYAGSGTGCWSCEAKSTQEWNGSHHVFQVEMQHNMGAEHISKETTVTLEFTHPLIDAYSEFASTLVNGCFVTVTRTSHGNAYKNGDKVTYKVWGQAADEATTRALGVKSVEVTCNKTLNVQGGGAGELGSN